MTLHTSTLPDQAARILAMSALDRTLLVEAGAGSGKTALMASRVVMLLASGTAPGSIAAVTFTELAASELLERIRHYVDAIIRGEIPPELALAAECLDEAARGRLAQAAANLDEIVCTTIHGFCQRLVQPFPAEAGIDPGAAVIDRGEADRIFDDLLDAWLRERLSPGVASPLIAELVHADANAAIKMVRELAEILRRPGPVAQPRAGLHQAKATIFLRLVDGLCARHASLPCDEPNSGDFIAALAALAVDVRGALDLSAPLDAVSILCLSPGDRLLTSAGTVRQLKCKTAFEKAVAAVGLPKAEGARLAAEITTAYDDCMAAWTELVQEAATSVQVALVDELQSLLADFRERKRRAAFLDFDDLIVSARDLLRDHPDARASLAERFRHVLVDEFQDTDPLQTEIFWRLCSEGPVESDWRRLPLRPGALFLVGDPKQAIYRFRGADVAAYLAARDALREADPADVLSISANFRSCESILSYANARFEAPLSGAGQPGFTSLSASIPDHGHAPCVAALTITSQGSSAQALRDAEAEAIASFCENMIDAAVVRGRDGSRPCRPGDIALLAPTGTDLWRYEEALERRGIPVATQAGKGFFHRQEVKDLIAITRVLADPFHDRLALCALLRSPMVGLTDEELLDLVEAQAVQESGENDTDLDGDGAGGSEESARDERDVTRRLELFCDLDRVANEVARETLGGLAALARQARSTTPHRILSEAVDLLRLRPILLARHRGHAERALANVDRFLEMARPYAVRGLGAFAEFVKAAWRDGARVIEGRPDAQEEAVSLVTMHSSKGLEWPVVIPINCTTECGDPKGPVIEAGTHVLRAKIMGAPVNGYREALDAEAREVVFERVRLWYVAATRARDYLVVPRHGEALRPGMWASVVELDLDALPEAAPPEVSAAAQPVANDVLNRQDRNAFAKEAAIIAAACPDLVWKTPSRAEGTYEGTQEGSVSEYAVAGSADIDLVQLSVTEGLQGGRLRGSVIHKLIEEILTGEIPEAADALACRARELVVAADAAQSEKASVDPADCAECALRALAVPDVAACRSRLVPEVSVYARSSEGAEIIVCGIADAVAFDEGKPEMVIDWKSDLSPEQKALDGYKAQIREYVAALGARRALVVFVSSGLAVPVT